jgi:uncharacterized damage-inducible protein DinB
MHQRFDIGHETVHATLVHMIGNVGTWTALMQIGHPRDRTDGWAEMGVPSLAAEHERSYAEFAGLARQTRDAGRWNDTWVDSLDDPPTSKTFGGAILHVITHNMHHRGELLHMLSRIGLTDLPEGDLLSWEARATAQKGVMTT